MAIYSKKGDLLKSKAEVLVNAVNCVGVSGKGIALSFKNKFPSYYETYKKQCSTGLLVPGKATLIKEVSSSSAVYILSIPTKNPFKNKSGIEDIERSLYFSLYLLSFLPDNYSIACPKLGAGEGGIESLVSVDTICNIWYNLRQDVFLYTRG